MDKETGLEQTSLHAAATKRDGFPEDEEAGTGAVDIERIDKVYR